MQAEVDERRKFLGEMERLGQGDKYRHIIETEISRVSHKLTDSCQKSIRCSNCYSVVFADGSRDGGH